MIWSDSKEPHDVVYRYKGKSMSGYIAIGSGILHFFPYISVLVQHKPSETIDILWLVIPSCNAYPSFPARTPHGPSDILTDRCSLDRLGRLLPAYHRIESDRELVESGRWEWDISGAVIIGGIVLDWLYS